MPVAKNPKKHGKRYSQKQKAAAVKEANKSTWKEASSGNKPSEQSISRWKKGTSKKKKS